MPKQHFRLPLPNIERPQMEADVVIVGGGPAGMACALRLSQLIDAHNAQSGAEPISKENIYVLEKAREVGQHQLSGAILDPRSMDELLPDWRAEAPIEAEVGKEAVYFLTEKSKFKLPIIPPPLENHGNYVISLNRFTKWLGEKVEQAGITVFSGFAGSALLYADGTASDIAGLDDSARISSAESTHVIGVRTDDKGLDKEDQQKSNFEPGYDLRAKVTILAEGPRGSLTKQLLARIDADRTEQHPHNPDSPRNPQTYGIGVKELWEIPAGRIAPGEVIHTMGWPLTSAEYGGSWIYGCKNNLISLGFVTGLDYRDPRLDPQHVLQSFKQHPFIRSLLEGGKLVRYGAKSLPYGGWFSLPQLAGPGWMIVGDSAGFLNSQRLKGIHLAIKSGMLAAEAAFSQLTGRQTPDARLQTAAHASVSSRVSEGREGSGFSDLRPPTSDPAHDPQLTTHDYASAVEDSWIKSELWRVRNFHQGFENGMLEGMVHAALQQVTFGRGLHARYASHSGHERLVHIDNLPALPSASQPSTVNGQPSTQLRGIATQLLGWAKGDGKLTFDKLTDVYHSGTKHEEDQPCHLVIHDTDICNNRCTHEYGNPCQYFCPAKVYEMVEVADATVSSGQSAVSSGEPSTVNRQPSTAAPRQIFVNFANCVHCKTCDIMDPYQIITWVPPEGGGGPNYDGM